MLLKRSYCNNKHFLAHNATIILHKKLSVYNLIVLYNNCNVIGYLNILEDEMKLKVFYIFFYQECFCVENLKPCFQIAIKDKKKEKKI